MWTEAIILAIIGFVQAVTLVLVRKGNKDSELTKDQVQNTHTINLRDDLDQKHEATISSIRRVEQELLGTKEDVRLLNQRDLEHSKHHDVVDGELSQIRRSLADHLTWSKDFIADYEKDKEEGK